MSHRVSLITRLWALSVEPVSTMSTMRERARAPGELHRAVELDEVHGDSRSWYRALVNLGNLVAMDRVGESRGVSASPATHILVPRRETRRACRRSTRSRTRCRRPRPRSRDAVVDVGGKVGVPHQEDLEPAARVLGHEVPVAERETEPSRAEIVLYVVREPSLGKTETHRVFHSILIQRRFSRSFLAFPPS
jgi:hypothetical protein